MGLSMGLWIEPCPAVGAFIPSFAGGLLLLEGLGTDALLLEDGTSIILMEG